MYLSTIYKPFFLSLMGVFVALCMSFSLASAGPLVGFGGVAATPTSYKVTVTKIEFFSGTWVTYFSGTCELDIASVAAGGSAGSCGAGATLPSGTYTQMRLTVNRAFGVTGAVADSDAAAAVDQRCRTNTGNGTTTAAGGGVTYSNVSLGTANDGAAATEQTINIPTASDGNVATTIDAISGMTIDSSGLTMTMNITFIVPEGEAVAPSGFGINFQVENKMEFMPTGAGACIAICLPPFITVTTSSGSFSFEPTL